MKLSVQIIGIWFNANQESTEFFDQTMARGFMLRFGFRPHCSCKPFRPICDNALNSNAHLRSRRLPISLRDLLTIPIV